MNLPLTVQALAKSYRKSEKCADLKALAHLLPSRTCCATPAGMSERVSESMSARTGILRLGGLIVFGAYCWGCQGGLGGSPGGSDAPSQGSGGGKYEDGDVPQDASCEDVGVSVGAGVMRRLSRIEYQLTLQDLFALPEPPPIDLVPEDIDQEGFTSFADVQSVTAQHLRAYLDTASALADDLEGDPERFAQVVGCDPSDANCLAEFVKRFGRLAFRRDLSDEESQELTAAAVTYAGDVNDQIRYAMEAILVSPHFLFRVEIGDKPEGLATLSAEELAAKLSFTLWGRGPSAALLQRAEAGELSTPDGLAQVAQEMIRDRRTEEYYQQFFRQWLGYSILRPPIEPPEDWSDELMPQMTAETDALVGRYAWTDGEDLFGALTANETTLSPGLAEFYGIVPDADGVVTFPDGHPRAGAGLLAHASILSQKTDGDKVSVRGNWLRKTFICEELHIPPNLAEVLGDQLVGLTSIEIIEQRNTQPACANCHSAIDPIGVGLAQFDATGRFDESVDLSVYPVAPGFPDAEDPYFGSMAELAAKLQGMPQLAECLSERVFVYAHGRHAGGEDSCSAEAAVRQFSDDGHSFPSLLLGLVTADGFRLRRAPLAL